VDSWIDLQSFWLMCIVTHGGADLGWVKKGRGVGSGSGGRVQRYRARQVLGGERGVESREREMWWSVEEEWVA
jgi:hypothetical protein